MGLTNNPFPEKKTQKNTSELRNSMCVGKKKAKNKCFFFPLFGAVPHLFLFFVETCVLVWVPCG